MLHIYVAIWVNFVFLFLLNAPIVHAHFVVQSDSDLIIDNAISWKHRVHRDDFLTKYKDVPETVVKEHLSKNLKLYFDKTECTIRNIQFFNDDKSQTIEFLLNFNCPLKFNEVRVLYNQFYANPAHQHILKLNYENRLQTFIFTPDKTEFQWERPTKKTSFQEYYKIVIKFLETGNNKYIVLTAIVITVFGLYKLLRRNTKNKKTL